jgi:Asp-tRNA(Asn)/Glu-tRNA(Gln) amidotransferase A subunit family amidase
MMAGSQAGPSLELHWLTGLVSKATLDAAQASRERWKAGKPLSVLDGVPFGVKDNQRVIGYPTRSGARLDKCVGTCAAWHARSAPVQRSTHDPHAPALRPRARERRCMCRRAAQTGRCLHACRPVETKDCPAVAALKAAGAVMIGMTTMPELGMSPVGLSAHHGTPKNPWNFAYVCGGSSSGAAAPPARAPAATALRACLQMRASRLHRGG